MMAIQKEIKTISVEAKISILCGDFGVSLMKQLGM
jgi:hypothetical protein